MTTDRICYSVKPWYLISALKSPRNVTNLGGAGATRKRRRVGGAGRVAHGPGEDIHTPSPCPPGPQCRMGSTGFFHSGSAFAPVVTFSKTMFSADLAAAERKRAAHPAQTASGSFPNGKLGNTAFGAWASLACHCIAVRNKTKGTTTLTSAIHC